MIAEISSQAMMQKDCRRHEEMWKVRATQATYRDM